MSEKKAANKLRPGDRVVLPVPMREGFTPMVTRVVKSTQQGPRFRLHVVFACGAIVVFDNTEEVQMAA